MQTTKAVQKLRYNGEKAELDLLREIHSKPGLNIYELSKKLDWSYGKTQSTVQRLREKGLIEIKQKIENNRVQCLVFEKKMNELIDFDKRELELMKKYLGE